MRPVWVLTVKPPSRPAVPAREPSTVTTVPAASPVRPTRVTPSPSTSITPRRSRAAAVSTDRALTSVRVRVICGRAAARAPSAQASRVSVPGRGWVTGAGPERCTVTAGSGRAASTAATVAIVPGVWSRADRP